MSEAYQNLDTDGSAGHGVAPAPCPPSVELAAPFLLERLGAQRYLDPKLMATILSLRQRLRDEWAITSAAETMLVDLALLSYYDALRVQGWTDDLAVRIEHEFFGDDAFTEMARRGHRHGSFRGRRPGPTAQRAAHAALRSGQPDDDPQSEGYQRVAARAGPRRCDRSRRTGDNHQSAKCPPPSGED
jgi:hypothetical protein